MNSLLDEWLDRPVGRWLVLNREKALYIALISVAVLTRLWGLGIRVQSHDESLHTKYSWNLYAGQGFQHTPLMHGPFLFHATALSYFLFGDNDFTARLVVALIGVAVVGFPYLLRRWIGRAGALAASFLLLISPSIAYYSRYIRHDIPVMLWALVVVLAIFSYLRNGREVWLYLMAAGIALAFATKEVAFIYHAIFGFFLIGLFARQALANDWGTNNNLKQGVGAALVAMAVGAVVLSLGVVSAGVSEADGGRALSWWAMGGGALSVGAFLVGLGLVLVGTWEDLRNYRTFDLIIVLGTLSLPFLSPIPIKLVGLDPVDYTTPTIYYSGAALAIAFGVSAAIGLLWDWRRWSIAAALHYGISIILFTTVFTNGGGIASGFVGSMGYWLAQQGVKRGGQPWYYYGIVVPLYEYLPLVLSLVTAGYVGIQSIARATREARPRLSDFTLDPAEIFVPFVLWWMGMAWAIYSYAGEKMPWLTVHLALPMILLAAWGVGRLIEAIDWERMVDRRAWVVALLAPPLVMAVGTFVDAALSGPFQGSTLTELTLTGQFLGSLVATIGLAVGLVWVAARSGWDLSVRTVLLVALVVPTLLTVRHAWHFCYINYGYPIEHLVYAHSTPAVRNTMEEIEELSRRVAGGSRLIKVAYGADGSWPFHWYLRDYPNAVFYGEDPSREQLDAPVIIAGRDQWDEVAPYTASGYTSNTYTYLWWPMEDYKGLSWQRIRDALSNPKMRAALWRIWYDRDYGLYDEVTGKTHTLDEWPLRSEYRLYIDREVVAQLWDRGALSPEGLEDGDPYAENRLELTAVEVFGEQGSGRGEFQSPRGIAVGPEGAIYVVDSGNHRVQKFTPEGEFLDAIGGRSLSSEEGSNALGFNEPWDVAVAPDGSVYVADTWNHRIQKLDAAGNPVASWGTFGDVLQDTGEAGHGLFYGPRGVALKPGRSADSEENLVYVTDTGNKRVQVFGENGAFAFGWGSGGAGDGSLDEPVGIAFGPEEEVFVADTWNRRIQVFDSDGVFVRAWRIDGWDSGVPEEKPYLAVDNEGRVYVTDPGYYRVLVFDSEGNFLASFGEYGSDDQSFVLPQGIALDQDGAIYVTDAHGHRVMRFDPIDFEHRDE